MNVSNLRKDFPDLPIHYFDELPSTNDYAKGLLADPKSKLPFLVWTGNQVRGRGRMNAKWEGEPGSNLTFSLGLTPKNLLAEHSFFLTQVASLSIVDFLKNFIPADGISIKWPNDVYFGSRKIAGILIENSLEYSKIESTIIGIGINVNQLNFKDLNATSLKKIKHIDYDLAEILSWFLSTFFARWQEESKVENLRKEYLDHMMGIHAQVAFDVQGKKQHGICTGIDKHGRIGIRIGPELAFFQSHEVKNFRPL